MPPGIGGVWCLCVVMGRMVPGPVYHQQAGPVTRRNSVAQPAVARGRRLRSHPKHSLAPLLVWGWGAWPPAALSSWREGWRFATSG